MFFRFLYLDFIDKDYDKSGRTHMNRILLLAIFMGLLSACTTVHDQSSHHAHKTHTGFGGAGGGFGGPGGGR